MITISSPMSSHAPVGPGAAATVAMASCVAAIASAGTVIRGLVVAGAVTIAIGAVAAAVDARTGRIPNRLVVLAAVAMVAGIVADAVQRPPAPVGDALIGVLAFAGPLLLGHVVSPSALGFGDVKLAAVLGAAVGLHDPRFGLVALCIATGTTALVGLVSRRSSMPLGPGLVAGAAAALLLAPGAPA